MVRDTTNSDGTVSWQLGHDYWCYAVIEAERRSDQWNVFLRDAHQRWTKAKGDLRKRWSLLLWPSQQAVLLWQNMRGRCHFGNARYYWWLSTASLIPYVLLALAGCFLADAYFDQRDESKALTYFAVIGRKLGDAVDDSEMTECFWPLSLEQNARLRLYFLKIGLTSPQNAERLERRAALAIQATVGIDPQMRLAVITDVLEPTTDSTRDVQMLLPCGALARAMKALTSSHKYRNVYIKSLMRQMLDKRNHYSRDRLSSDFVAVAAGHKAAEAFARPITEAMKEENSAHDLIALSKAFRAANGADHELQVIVASRLTQAIQSERDAFWLPHLVEEFAAGSGTSDQAATVSLRLVDAIQAERDPARLAALARTFAVGSWSPDQAAAVSRRLVDAILMAEDSYRIYDMSEACAMVRGATPDQFALIARRLLEMTITHNDISKITRLSDSFASLGIGKDKAEAFARPIIEAIQKERDGDRLAALARAFAAGSGSADQAVAVSRRLVDAIQAERDRGRLAALAEVFAVGSGSPDQGGDGLAPARRCHPGGRARE